MPSGFTIDNCKPISWGINISASAMDYGQNQSTHVIGVRRNSGKYYITCGALSGSGTNGSKSYEVSFIRTDI